MSPAAPSTLDWHLALAPCTGILGPRTVHFAPCTGTLNAAPCTLQRTACWCRVPGCSVCEVPVQGARCWQMSPAAPSTLHWHLAPRTVHLAPCTGTLNAAPCTLRVLGAAPYRDD